MVNAVIITQARIGSSRLPSKILKTIQNKSLLEIQLSRLKRSKLNNGIVVATTFEKGVEKIIRLTKKYNINLFQGDNYNVLDRYYNAARFFSASYIVRVTSDCPLIDPKLIDYIIKFTVKKKLDYCSNVLINNYPDGQDIEVFKFNVLEDAWKNAKLDSEKEHVTPYIINNSDFNKKGKFKALNFSENLSKQYSKVRMTVDYKEDFEAIDILIRENGQFCNWEVYADYILNNQNKFKNQNLIRNESFLKQIENEKKSDRTKII